MAADPSTFAAVFVALVAAHEVGDHWVQMVAALLISVGGAS